MPVRTQCLTSAAVRQCPHPNSFALFSPIPKLASAARPPATRHHQRKSAYSIDPRAFICLLLLPPECLALLQPSDANMLCCFSQDASTGSAYSRGIPKKDGKTRNDYRSASRRVLQVSCQLLDFDRRHTFKFLLDGLGLVLGRALLQGFGCPIDQVLGFLQAE